MTFTDHLTSAYRFLTQEQRAMFSPCSSEQASRSIQAAAAQRGIRMPGVNHG